MFLFEPFSRKLLCCPITSHHTLDAQYTLYIGHAAITHHSIVDTAGHRLIYPLKLLLCSAVVYVPIPSSSQRRGSEHNPAILSYIARSISITVLGYVLCCFVLVPFLCLYLLCSLRLVVFLSSVCQGCGCLPPTLSFTCQL